MMDSKNIFSINIDCRESGIIELKPHIERERPLFVLIQDPPHRSISQVIEMYQTVAPNYRIIPQDFADETLGRGDNSEVVKLHNLILVHPEVHIVRELHQESEPDQQQQQEESSPESVDNLSSLTRGAYSIGLSFRLKLGGPAFKIFSLYIRPRAGFIETRNTLDWIREQSKDCHGKVIVMGDVNADAHEWAPARYMLTRCIMRQNHPDKEYKNIKINRGITISNFMRDYRLKCLNRPKAGPTHQMVRGYANSYAYIDLALVGLRAARIWSDFKLIKLENAEHRLVQISCETPAQDMSEKEPREAYRLALYQIKDEMFRDFRKRVQPYCARRMLPEKFRISAGEYEDMYEKMHRLATELICTLRSVQNMISKKRQYRKKTYQSELFSKLKMKMIRKLKQLRERQKAFKKHSRRYRHLEKIQKNIRFKLTRSLNINVRDEPEDHREETITTPEIMDNTWKCFQELDNDFGPKESTIDIEQADGIKTTAQLEQICAEKFPDKDRNEAYSCVEQIFSVENNRTERGSVLRNQLHREEVDMAIKRLWSKSYKGIDGINVKTLTRSYRFIKDEVYHLCRMSFQLTRLPECCSTSLGKLIPKKEPGKYRIVHISTALSALLEQIAMRKLEFSLEKYNLYSMDQYGFTANVSRHDLIARVLSVANTRLQLLGNMTCTIIISLDIEGAFDNVDQTMLIKKLLAELPADVPVKYWLANFMLRKEIVIKHKNLTSNPRPICTGVPQGSSLGPILWNYTINNIGDVLKQNPKALANKFELLAYADDIYLMYKGVCHTKTTNEIQAVLNRLSNWLANIRLRINPQKSVQIDFHRNENERRKGVHINNVPIAATRSINILGVQIKRRIALDRSKLADRKIAENVRKLYFMNRLKLLRFNFQWKAMIDGLIRSITTINNFPILALDEKSRRWNDSIIDRAMRNIFRWPNNVSIKLVRLITGNLLTSTDVKQQVVHRMVSARDNSSYMHLADCLGIDWFPDQSVMDSLEQMAQRERRYHDPHVHLKFRDVNKIKDFEGSSWVPIETRKGTLMVQQSSGKVLNLFCGIHADYPINYFNTMAMVWFLFTKRNDIPSRSRTLTLAANDSLLSAMQNWNNHDWRTIMTKETLAKWNWLILRVPRRELEALKQKLMDQIKINGINVHELTEPNVIDYRLRHYYKQLFKKEIEQEYNEAHTTVTRGICEDYKTWQKLSMSCMSSVQMLALTGLIVNDSGNINQLEMGKVKPGETPEGCGVECASNSLEPTSVAVHRMTSCPRYRPQRDEVANEGSHSVPRTSEGPSSPSRGRKRKSLDSMLKDTDGGVRKVLKLLSDCAFDTKRS